MKNLKKVSRDKMKTVSGGIKWPPIWDNCSPQCCPTDGRRRCPGMICPDVVCPDYV